MYTTKADQLRLDKHGLTATEIQSKFPEDQFLIAHIYYRPAVHLGVSINAYDGIVVVSRVDKDSLSYLRFEIADIIIDVDGEQVRDKNDFRNYIMDAMDRNSYASVLIQRPFSPKSVKIAKTALGLAQKDPLDPPLPHDAMIIGRKEMQRLKGLEQNKNKCELRPILNSSPSKAPPQQNHLVFSEEKPREMYINSDVAEGKKLTPCPTRAQLHARLRSKISKKNKKNLTKAEREVLNTPMDPSIPPETNTEPPMPPPSSSSPDGKPKDESLLRRAQDSWKEKRSRMFSNNNSKKDNDSDSSSRKKRTATPKKKIYEKEQISDSSKNTNSDKSLKKRGGDGSEREKKKKVVGNSGIEDGSERRNRNDEGSERQRRRNHLDDPSKKRKQQRL